MDNIIANAFYNEDYKKLEKLTGIKATSQKEFEEKFTNKDKLTILIPAHKNKKQTDSLFYYSGDTIATLGGYTLIVAGHITIKFKENECWYKDDNAVEALLEKNYTDKDIQKLYDKGFIDENNWFEVILPDGDCVLGDTANTYDEAIDMLETYYKEKI